MTDRDWLFLSTYGKDITLYVKRLAEVICNEYGLAYGQFLGGSSRERRYVYPRVILWIWLHDIMGYSFPRIGRMFNRDHSTVQWAVNDMVLSKGKVDRCFQQGYPQLIEDAGWRLAIELDHVAPKSPADRIQGDSDYAEVARLRSRRRAHAVFPSSIAHTDRKSADSPLSQVSPGSAAS